MVTLAAIVGALIGVIITIAVNHMWFASGTLRIDRSNPEKDVYRLELGDLDRLAKKKRVVVKIDNCADLSRK